MFAVGSQARYSGFSWAKRPMNLSSVFPNGKLFPSDIWLWLQLKYQEMLLEADVGKMWTYSKCVYRSCEDQLSHSEQIQKQDH